MITILTLTFLFPTYSITETLFLRYDTKQQNQWYKPTSVNSQNYWVEKIEKPVLPAVQPTDYTITRTLLPGPTHRASVNTYSEINEPSRLE